MDSKSVLRIEGISKTFPGVKALDSISFDIQEGTVHALVGENGAGKSTLINILSGIYQPDEGHILFDGKPLRCKAPVDAQNAGISVIHQELKLSETLSVMENIFLGNLILTPRFHLVDWDAMRKRAKEMVDNLGIDLDVEAVTGTLSVAKKQIVEICKAISKDAKVIIMDEPSATLTDRELNVLFETVRSLRAKNYTVIYISHRMDEIFGLADNVTVLRDGQHIKTLPISEVTRESLIGMMVGRRLGNEYIKHQFPVSEEIILEAKDITCGSAVKNVSMKVRKGEVLGISGLVGAGRTELARALLGIDRISSETIFYKGAPVSWNFRTAIAKGVGLVPEDRKQQGLILGMPVRQNITMVAMRKIVRKLFIRNKMEEEYARKYVDMLSISTPSINSEVRNLSGGNQQKVVISKWLLQDSEILILDEPTRGVDVGAKREIYAIIKELVEQGKTIIVISSEMAELIGICDRIMVMAKGRLAGEFQYGEATQEKILALCV